MSPKIRTFKGLRATDPEAEKAFVTYKNYLAHMKGHLDGTYGVGDSLHDGVVDDVLGQKGIGRIHRRKATKAERDAIASSLRISWIKELQLDLPSAVDPSILPELVQDSPHLAYYAVYHAAWGLFAASRQSMVAKNHAAALGCLGDMVAKRSIVPALWSVICTGGPTRREMVVDHLPPGAPTLAAVSSLSAPGPSTVWDSLALALRTTRTRQIDNRKDQWRRANKKKRVPAAEAKKLASTLGPTTLFDFLWRLRTRSDYQDADAFLSGISHGGEAAEFHEAIATLVAATLAVIETLTVVYVGPDLYRDESKRFLKRVTGNSGEAVRARSAAVLERL